VSRDVGGDQSTERARAAEMAAAADLAAGLAAIASLDERLAAAAARATEAMQRRREAEACDGHESKGQSGGGDVYGDGDGDDGKRAGGRGGRGSGKKASSGGGAGSTDPSERENPPADPSAEDFLARKAERVFLTETRRTPRTQRDGQESGNNGGGGGGGGGHGGGGGGSGGEGGGVDHVAGNIARAVRSKPGLPPSTLTPVEEARVAWLMGNLDGSLHIPMDGRRSLVSSFFLSGLKFEPKSGGFLYKE
jgi:hypothetical protein